LLAEVPPCAGGWVVDLGCGTGALTAELHARSGARLTLGVDASAAMLAQARPAPGLAFVRADLAAFRPRSRADVVFSNAALHWVSDHARLVPALLDLVHAGGQLAFQVPSNDAHPSHRVAAEVAEEEPFATALEGFVRRTPVLEPADYAALLRAAGAADVRAEARVFEHVLSSPADVVTWVRGTTLTAYERRLSPELYARYLERYTARLLAVFGDGEAAGAPFRYPFRRTFVWAVR
jgi:trans-aconitate 2-methyltransferase